MGKKEPRPRQETSPLKYLLINPNISNYILQNSNQGDNNTQKSILALLQYDDNLRNPSSQLSTFITIIIQVSFVHSNKRIPPNIHHLYTVLVYHIQLWQIKFHLPIHFCLL